MSCCSKCAKAGGEGGGCGPGSQQSSGFDACGNPIEPDTLGPRGRLAGTLGAGDQTVNVGGTPTWELALIAASGVAIGIFANAMYRRRHAPAARRR